MSKCKSSSFVAEFRILTPAIWMQDYLNKKFNIANKIYNTSCKYYKKLVEELYNDERYINIINKLKSTNEKSERNKLYKELKLLITEYKITEYDIHAYIAIQKQKAFNKSIGINIAQKIGTALYKSINKAIYTNTKIHFRKYGTTCTIEDKKANSGIIFNINNNTVKITGKIFNIKPIRKNDYYLQECITHKIKYCRVVRKPFSNGFKYFLQVIFEGVPPKKFTLGSGKCGLDEGISTIAIYNNSESSFKVLGNGIEKYNKEIKKYNLIYQRKMRLNNPQCFYENGSFLKGSKFINKSKNSQKVLMKLKNAYRKRTVFINQLHNKYINELITQCNTVIKEPMNFKAFQRKAKNNERSNKISKIKQKDGTFKEVNKFKKKKRFGKSINNRSPGLFNKKLEDKFNQYNGTIINVNSIKYKASKTNHITKEPENILLSDRTKLINNNLVQRDLYSAFLLYNIDTIETIDFNQCNKLFEDFLQKQEKVINEVKIQGDVTKNFGLKDFINK